MDGFQYWVIFLCLKKNKHFKPHYTNQSIYPPIKIPLKYRGSINKDTTYKSDMVKRESC